ncbi:Imm51 family immunity protein [Listeria monocytogenes]|uniref:Imm51 family immunity protein n=1 Tax=Listeria monocytogenes TaxID=1639 RepID=UPI000854F21E|nr:Imm51 family immunity protein [Listeria monocytogenes]EAD7602548.1 hypothetical protein [Listeria monocytogenes]EAG5903471.1 hypothetical protein [Listeria monocytogenes]EHG9403076.1 hypothetical protein [Listeria monocytogenes]EHP6529625.1 hypothetical protein [Listeria monocytogenes]EJA0791819.1 hypothetical protein [Listeria monocytogenes]
MENYVSIVKVENNLSVCFYNSSEKVVAIAKKMNEINEDAYMHGYNWEAFFNYYLPEYAPDVLEGMGSDPEAGMYVAYYTLSPETEARAEKLVQVITNLIENEELLYQIIENEGNNISWDN